MDSAKIEKLIKELIIAIGEDVEREGLQKTPSRVAESFERIFGGYDKNPKDLLTQFDGENYDEMIKIGRAHV